MQSEFFVFCCMHYAESSSRVARVRLKDKFI